jgi:hypothetical protein
LWWYSQYLSCVDEGGVKVIQQPPSILKRKFTFADSSKPAVPVSVITEEKKDDSGSCHAIAHPAFALAHANNYATVPPTYELPVLKFDEGPTSEEELYQASL